MRVSHLALTLALIGTALFARGEERAWSEDQKHHWSFLPPRRLSVPMVSHSGWVRNPIDGFILREIERIGLEPAPEADRVTLIRRLRFDLTGLPPTPQEVDGFVGDARPDAYERLVDRLLESPQYGERWARPWLDLARFAESDGFKSDKTRPNAWRYRDWVVQALNADLPYDRFVQLQIAGEEVAPGDPDAFIASAFNRHFPFEDNNKVPGLNRQLMLEDMTDTTTAVFLGLTVACARCHDHKYDAISQKDYYRVQALFAAVAPKDDRPLADPFDVAVHDFLTGEHRSRVAAVKREVQALERPHLAELIKDKLAKLPAEVRKAFATEPEKRSAFQEDLLEKFANAMAVDTKAMRAAMPPETRRLWEDRSRTMAALVKDAPPELPSASGMITSEAEAKPVRLLRKGNYVNLGEVVAPGFLSVLTPGRVSREEPRLGRNALAEWLTRPEHPLTARVMVNRLWQGHFGRGIVATPSDFGTQGSPPTHPELLDWLACEFVARGWSLKAMHRLMVTSASYRQSSVPSARAREEDPDNVLFGRMPRRRLEAEAVRDALLAVSGQLDGRMGGPSVFPDLPPGITTRGGWTRSQSESDRNRRSLYVFVRRNLKYPLFDAFDSPDTNVTCPERNVSVNAPQALMLLNSDVVLAWARQFARRVEVEAAEPGYPRALVRTAYRIGLGREPNEDEEERGARFLQQAGANGSTKGESLDDFCHTVLNLNEFVFVD
jgi:hypothetical protein